MSASTAWQWWLNIPPCFPGISRVSLYMAEPLFCKNLLLLHMSYIEEKCIFLHFPVCLTAALIFVILSVHCPNRQRTREQQSGQRRGAQGWREEVGRRRKMRESEGRDL